MSAKSKPPSKPLPLSDVLRDLAVLRSSGRDIPELFKIPITKNDTVNGTADAASQVDSSVALSYEYVQVSRAAIRLHDSGKMDMKGGKIEDTRIKYESLLEGLDG